MLNTPLFTKERVLFSAHRLFYVVLSDSACTIRINIYIIVAMTLVPQSFWKSSFSFIAVNKPGSSEAESDLDTQIWPHISGPEVQNCLSMVPRGPRLSLDAESRLPHHGRICDLTRTPGYRSRQLLFAAVDTRLTCKNQRVVYHRPH
jgi:hypothetical protein